MPTKKTQTIGLYFSVVIIAIASIFFVNGLILAWTPPASTPPAGNVDAPLNVGPTGQSKAGGLILNTGGAATGLIIDKGNVGIGDSTPGVKLEVNGNVIADTPTQDNHLATKAYVDAQAGGGVTCDKVLTSDAGSAYNGYSAHEYCQARGYQYAMSNISAGNCFYQGPFNATSEEACSSETPRHRPLGSSGHPLWCCK